MYHFSGNCALLCEALSSLSSRVFSSDSNLNLSKVTKKETLFFYIKDFELDSFYPASERNLEINSSIIHIHRLQGKRHTVRPALSYCHVRLGSTRPEAASLVLGEEQLSSHLRVPNKNPAAILVQCRIFSLANSPWPRIPRGDRSLH